MLALLIAIPAEVCFTLYKDFYSFIYVYGHALKIAYYYQLFRAVFASSVTYPHIMLETERNRIRQMNEELNAAHEALQSAHLRLREMDLQKESILNALPIGIVTYDESGRMSFANDVSGQLFGCKKENMYGLTLGKILGKFPKLEGKENLVESILKTETHVQALPVYPLKRCKVGNGIH